VLIGVDGVPVGVDGTYEFRKNERLNFSHLIQSKQLGQNSAIRIVRDSREQTVNVKFADYVGLVPYPNYFKKPPYFIYGGLVFTVLSTDLLQSWGKEWWQKAPIDFLHYLVGKGRLNADNKKEIVVLLEVLPDDINIGYHDYRNEVIRTINGKTFSSFQEFIKLIRDNQAQPYTIFETEQSFPLIIQTKNIDTVDQNILLRNNIPARYSADVSGWMAR